MSILPKKLGHKMFVAFSLASVIPALTFLYLLQSPVKAFSYLGFVGAIVISIISLGYYLANSIVSSVRELTMQAQSLVMGDLHKKIRLEREEEIARLAGTFNKLAEMVNDSTANVRAYMEKTNEKEKELQMKLQAIEQEPFLDSQTGLYKAGYVKRRLNEEIKRAVLYQKPCSFVIFDVDDYDKMLSGRGEKEILGVLKDIAAEISGLLSEVDILGRLSDDSLCLVAPERSKQKAYELAESIRKAVQSKGKVTLSCGVSENPIDGVSAEEIFKKAQTNAESAKARGKNKVVA